MVSMFVLEKKKGGGTGSSGGNSSHHRSGSRGGGEEGMIAQLFSGGRKKKKKKGLVMQTYQIQHERFRKEERGSHICDREGGEVTPFWVRDFALSYSEAERGKGARNHYPVGGEEKRRNCRSLRVRLTSKGKGGRKEKYSNHST